MTAPFHCPSCQVGWTPKAPDWDSVDCWNCGGEGLPGAPKASVIPPGTNSGAFNRRLGFVA